jgi:uncharacterized membrane protein YedE/YeeE
MIAVMMAIGGGALIGVGASVLLLFDGRLGAISGIIAGLLQRPGGEWAWRAAFVAGMVVAGRIFASAVPAAVGSSPAPWPLLLVAGGAVGFGARWGGGCTSGHGVCGTSRLSRRSIVATITFMTTGALMVTGVRVFGGVP